MKETLDNANPFSESGKGDIRFHWEDARAFLAIARAGTLSGAGASLGVGLATVSRRIERLETAFGAKLFSRHQNGYRLTDDGSTLLDRAVALEEAADAFAEGSLLQAEATGKVRLSTADTLATYLIIPNMPALTTRYPGLCLEVLTNVQTVNLHRRDADLAVRMVKPERGNVQVRCLGSLGFGLRVPRLRPEPQLACCTMVGTPDAEQSSGICDHDLVRAARSCGGWSRPCRIAAFAGKTRGLDPCAERLGLEPRHMAGNPLGSGEVS